MHPLYSQAFFKRAEALQGWHFSNRDNLFLEKFFKRWGCWESHRLSRFGYYYLVWHWYGFMCSDNFRCCLPQKKVLSFFPASSSFSHSFAAIGITTEKKDVSGYKAFILSSSWGFWDASRIEILPRSYDVMGSCFFKPLLYYITHAKQHLSCCGSLTQYWKANKVFIKSLCSHMGLFAEPFVLCTPPVL